MTLMILAPTIQTKLAENGSPRAIFETTDDRLTFLVNIPVHEECDKSSETKPKSSETKPKSSERKTKSSERKPKSSERILDLIKSDPKIAAAEIAMKIDMSSRGVEKQIKKLRESGIIKRNGADFGGCWEIITSNNDKG